ncbi:MAG: T9SS type A sorting domain-containing protein [Crocinitomix sp.]|nr:T9SS type A sorting domain-containing protein [Crocinitomix sp.]
MKKTYLVVAGAILSTVGSYAQFSSEHAYLPIEKNNQTARDIGLHADNRDAGDIIIGDDFSEPDNWLIYSKEGTDPEWFFATNDSLDEVLPYMGGMESTTADNGFAVFNGIEYLLDDTPGVPEQDAYIEYAFPINCTGIDAVLLEFQQRYRAFNTDQTFLEVTATTWDDGEYVAYEINALVPTNDPAIQTTEVINISEIAGGESTVRIRFRWLETTLDGDFGAGYAWFVDDLIVSEAWDYDQQITAAYHRSGIGVYMPNGMEYYMIPPTQITDIIFFGETENMAGLVQPNAKLNVDVVGGAGFSGTSPSFDLAVGASESVSCSVPFIPTTEGTYDITYFFDSDGVEEVTDNDTLYDLFTVTNASQNFVYSRDNGISSSSISNVASNTSMPLLIGNVMDIFATDKIGAVDIVVSDAETNVGQEIFAQVMILEGGVFVYADQTENHEITVDENGGIITIVLETPIDVAAGQTVLVLAGHYGGADEVEFRMAQAVEEETVLGYTSGASEPFLLLEPSAIMVRPHMRNYAGLSDNTQGFNFTIDQNVPNPFGTQSVINYELNEAAAVSVEFIDVTGKIVKTVNKGLQSAGTYTIELDANDFAEGVYFYSFNIGNQKVAKRMVITK